MTLFFIASFIFGVIIGSFLNVVILRLPQKHTLGGRSFCPHCKHELNPLDLVPLLSFIMLRGRCRYCGKGISPRYPVIELITGMLFAATLVFFNPIIDSYSLVILLKAFIILAICVVVFVTDLEHFLIFDKVVLVGSVFMVLMNLTLDFLRPAALLNLQSTQGLISAGGLFIIFYLIWFISRGKWLGFGDVKYVIFIGLALGVKAGIAAFWLTFLVASLVLIPLLLIGKAGMKTKIPLGCFLSIGTIIALFYGTTLCNWYLNLIGFGV